MSGPQHTPTLLVLIASLCLVAALAWLLLARARSLSPRPARAMAAVNVLLACGISLYVQRGQAGWPPALGYQGSSLFLLAGFALMWMFGPVIAHERAQWRPPLAVALSSFVLLCLLPAGSPLWLSVSAGGLTLLTLGIARVNVGLLRRSLSWPSSLGLASPYLLLALLFGLRSIASLLLPESQLSLVHQSSANALWLWICLLMVLVVNTQVAFMLVLRLVLKLRQLTREDPLTGAMNRRAFDQRLQRAQAEFQRGMPHALVVLDMDHFKRLNDELGHAAGDAALCALVAQMRPLLREVDALARLGGEEFGLLLCDCDIGGAALVAERLRQLLQALDWQWEGRPWPLAASFGVAAWQAEDSRPEDVYARADAALYEAKRLGRGLVR